MSIAEGQAEFCREARRPENQPNDQEIMDRISGGESLRSIAKLHGMAESTIRLRFSQDPDLAAQYARAREAQADHYAEKIVDEAMAATDPQIGRLRMDALKWAASKLAPRRYSDTIKLADADGGKLGLAALVGAASTKEGE